MMARAADQLVGQDAHLVSASFRRISCNRLALRTSVADAADDAVVGRVEFGGAAAQAWDIVELPDPAPRADAPMRMGVALVALESPLNAIYQFHTENGDFESVLNVLVQAIKSLHEELAPEVHDVWFTGIRRFPLPQGGWPSLLAGRVRIMCRRVGRSGQQYQSLVEAVIEDDACAEVCRGFVTFAFKSPKELNVH